MDICEQTNLYIKICGAMRDSGKLTYDEARAQVDALVAAARREMALAACKLMCTLCESGMKARFTDNRYWHDSPENVNYAGHYCEGTRIRRVYRAKYGQELDAAPKEKP